MGASFPIFFLYQKYIFAILHLCFQKRGEGIFVFRGHHPNAKIVGIHFEQAFPLFVAGKHPNL
jgi:hypothetical protein